MSFRAKVLMREIMEFGMKYLKPLVVCLHNYVVQAAKVKLSIAQIAIALLAPCVLLAAGTAAAQSKAAYRCPSVNGVTHFTDNKAEADRLGCSVLTGGNVTVIEGTRVQPSAPAAGATAPVRVAAAPQAGSRIDGAEQRSRDSDSRSILENELRKAESKQADLLKEYNNGEPGKIGGEAQNNQKYLDRVAEMKANIARNDSDIASIKRELGRTTPRTAQ
jgi:hypothetical protein